MNRLIAMTTSRTHWLVVSALLLGFMAGQTGMGDMGRAATEGISPGAVLLATATRQAELTELEHLRAEVGQASTPMICTPVPTAASTTVPSPTATPTAVPPVTSGEPLPYADDWTVTVTGISLIPIFSDLTADGIFAQVHLTITNNWEAQRAFPYDELRLRDAEGRVFLRHPIVASRNEAGTFFPFPPFVPTDGFIVFAAAADTVGPFVLESVADPTFRVEVEIERRG